MRRKSERNKAKGPSEKKVDKPTRRITRRRGRTSPSPSPEQQTAEDNVSSTPFSEDNNDPRLLTEEDNGNEKLEKDVSSTELIKSVLGGEEEDSGSVWTVARADASPGEIQKLKLCRQRNTSEASDSSISKKKSNKWPDSGDGGLEEAESVNEQVASSQMSTSEQTENPSSSHPGQDSREEVSDYKENLPETTSANLSDDQTNIDQQAEYKENLQETSTSATSTTLTEAPTFCEDNQSSSPPNVPVINNLSQPSCSGDYVAEISLGNLPINEPDHDQENSNEASCFHPTTTAEPSQLIEINPSINDESINIMNEITSDAISVKQNIQISQDSIIPCDENKKEEGPHKPDSLIILQDTSLNDETNSEIVIMHNETSDTDFAESRKELENDETEEGEIREEIEKEPSPDLDCVTNTKDKSELENACDSKSSFQEMHSLRRKRNKYHESSPDTSKSGDENSTVKAKRKMLDSAKVDDKKVEKKNKKKITRSYESKDDVSANSQIESDNNVEKEDILEINEKSDDLNVSVSCAKPTKVSLKRSFSNRLSTDAETKKEESNIKKNVTNESNPNKENHADNEQPDQKCQTKRRRWGITTSDVAPAFSISTDSLKALVPGAKPVSVNEVKLTKDEDDEKEQRKRKNKSSGDSDSKNDAVASKSDATKKNATKTENHTNLKIQVTIFRKILLIRNLVRPFTLNQIKELLSRTGTIVENGFWIDRIKSKCFVEYANEDQAFETKQALHGISWPSSNPKKLIVEYATKNDMEQARESSIPKKEDPLLSADLWQQDSWARDDRPVAVNKISIIREWDLGKEDGQMQVKEKERERKEFEKKKRPRSRSPVVEAHLPAPARKFKKKEEEPPTAKLLDDLFRKTKATPCIYWLPLTNEQIAVKEEIRRQHMAEHARRLEEIRRVERGRSRGDVRRRRSPRK